MWKVRPRDIEEESGRDVHFKCEAVSRPSPDYKWTKNGKPLLEDKHLYVNPEGNEIKIDKIAFEDMANYSCIAENDLGRIETFFKIKVLS